MIDDPIVNEVRQYRQEHAALFNYDLEAIVADLLQREQNSPRPVINRSPRRMQNTLNDIAPAQVEKPYKTSMS